MDSLTIFTAPKPFSNPHINIIQTNAISSWKQLGKGVRVVLLGNDHGISSAANELGVDHIPNVHCNEKGTPIISSMFELTRKKIPSSLYMIINTDIILLPGINKSIHQVSEQTKNFLIVGQRWDLNVQTPIDFSGEWEIILQKQMKIDGKLHPRGGSDYFIFPPDCYLTIPDFAIGRAGWDNWMIYEARRNGWKVIDATGEIQIIHQNHDYQHLPDGKPHYRLPETYENVRLAGGNLTIFTLDDCDTILKSGQISKAGWNWKKIWREIEIFPLIGLKSLPLAQLFFAFFHPVKAYREIRAWQRRPEQS